MDTQQGFTLKQHLSYLLLSVLISGTGIFLDIHYQNLQHSAKALPAPTKKAPSEIIFSNYEVTHSTISVVEV